MAEAQTIDLAAIPALVSEPLLNLPFPDGDEELREMMLARYSGCRDHSESMFDDWLKETNSKLLDKVDDFVNNALENGNNKFFIIKEAINIATVILGMQNSDHLPTIDMIEERISKKPTRIQILRLHPDLEKKSALISMFEALKDRTHTFVIIEQIETFPHHILEALVMLLSDSLKNRTMITAMILACMSGSWANVALTLPPDIMNRVRKPVHLVKDPGDVINEMRARLLESSEQIFKIGPNVMTLIENNFIERDASLANLKYLYQYSMYEHLSKPYSLLASSKKELDKLLKAKIPIEEFLSKLPSMRDDNPKKSKSNNVSEYCSKLCLCIEQYHEFAWTQMRYYFELLRDETRTGFPTEVQDIYLELSKHEDLGQSVLMHDAIARLRKMSHDKILERLEKCTSDYQPVTKALEDNDIFTTLIIYKDKLDCEEDKASVIKNLILKLHKHVEVLKNPLRFPLNEAIYYNDEECLRRRALPSTRLDAVEDFTSQSTYFGVLYNMIYGHAEDICLADLFNDFVAAINENQQKITKPQIVASKNVKMKTTARRATRVSSDAQSMTNGVQEKAKSNAESLDEGLIKAIFLDLLDCMEYQGLIKSESRTSRRGFIKKCTWL